MDVYNRKFLEFFFYVEQFPLVASGHALFRIPQSSILASGGRTYPNMGFKMTRIIDASHF